VPSAVTLQARNDQNFGHTLLWESEICFALLKEVTWRNCQYSTLLEVAVCDVSEHFVYGQLVVPGIYIAKEMFGVP
jgi:hypothetical protein